MLILLATLTALLATALALLLARPAATSSSPPPASTPTPTPPADMSRNAAAAAALEQFAAITGAAPRDAQKYMAKHKRLDAAVDAWFADASSRAPQLSTQKINALFDKYKDPEGDGDTIAVDGTIGLCGDLGVDPEDAVLLALAHELKSPTPGEWTRKGWADGLRALGVDTLDGLRAAVATLAEKLRSDRAYFARVYAATFGYVLPAGARSLGTETALAFWGVLLPVARAGGGAWDERYDGWWAEYLEQAGVKGVSKDTWTMFLEFVRTIDDKFENYDETESWPSTIDDFVAYARNRLAGQ